MACDLRYSTHNSQMQFDDVEMFLNGGVGTIPVLKATMGIARTKKVLYEPEMINGKRAEHLGLVNKSIEISRDPDVDSAYEHAVSVADEILESGRPRFNELCKMAIDEWTQPLADGGEEDLLRARWLAEW